MTIEATTSSLAPHADTGAVIHPLWVRITHWINALAMLVMIGSGWQIYDASPLFDFEFPSHIALGNWLAGALLWHFAAMWVLVINGIVYVTLGIATGRFWPQAVPDPAARGDRDTCSPRCAASSRTTTCRCTTRCRSCFISA